MSGNIVVVTLGVLLALGKWGQGGCSGPTMPRTVPHRDNLAQCQQCWGDLVPWDN